MIDLPEPLTPADCDLRGMPYMPLHVVQLLQSETFSLASGDEFKAALALWCASWLEVPAGSLPDKDEMLQELSRSKKWGRVRARAMSGWIKCSDGRLYHKVIAEAALNAWELRLLQREKSEARNDRQQRWRTRTREVSQILRSRGITPPAGASLATLETLLSDSDPAAQQF